MSQGLINVTLNRDGITTPWGFRLHGGKDIGYPLAIQRVFLGSPSERELQRGDILVRINDNDSIDMTHIEAHDVIKAAGNQLRLLIHRLPGAPQSPCTPTSSGATMHPLANAAPPASFTKPATSFQPFHAPKVKPTTPSGPLPWASPVMNSVLPTSSFLAQSLSNRRLNEVQQRPKEKASIASQGYRTVPLATSGPKLQHDIPMGSYLRHAYDHSGKGMPSAPLPKPYFMNQAQPQPFSTPSCVGARSVAAPAEEDGPHLVHLQYNSPMGLYSRENVQRTMQAHTDMQPNVKPKSPVPAIKTKFSPAANQASPLSPTPGAFTPARPGTKLTNIVDITLSPTFQLIQEAENRSSSPKPEPKTPPPVVTRPPQSTTGATGFPCGYSDPTSNAFGAPRETIHQSGSFKTLMATLAMTGQQQEF